MINMYFVIWLNHVYLDINFINFYFYLVDVLHNDGQFILLCE